MTKGKKPTSPRPLHTKTLIQKSILTEWFDTYFSKLALAILIVAGLLRISLLLELPQMPFNQLHRQSELDMHFFDQWGDRIAQGDILTDTIWHPYHSWHQSIARGLGIQDDQQAKEKWNTWYGGTQYHQEPLYPLIIGMAKMTGPHGRWITYLLQMLASMFSIWMMMWLGRHYFGAMAGILGGLLFSLYGPHLLYDVTLLRTSFSTTLMLALLVVHSHMMAGKNRLWLMGLLGGVGYVFMSSLLLLWIPLVLHWLYHQRSEIKRVWQLALPFALILAPLALRNHLTESPLFSVSSVGPITYVLSNFPGYKPEHGFAYFLEAGKIMNRADGKMIPAAWETMGLHKSLWHWVALQFKKLGAVFHWYEIPNNINYYLAQAMSTSLKITFIPFAMIASMGVSGFLLSLRRKSAFPLHIALLSQVSILVIFYVLSRFRVPMVGLLAIYGGYAIQRISETQHLKRSIITLILTLLSWIFVSRPAPHIPVLFNKGDVSTYFQLHYLPLLEERTAQRDIRGCIPLIESLLHTMPKRFADISSPSELKTLQEKELASYYGTLHYDQSNLYRDIGESDKAEVHLKQSVKLKGK